jgi:uncharacterized protein YjdB
LKKLLLVAVFAILGAFTGCYDASLPSLTSIQISPANPTVAAGNGESFTAQGTFSNNTMRDVTSLVTWSSSNTQVATIGPRGQAVTFIQGTSTISAAFTTPHGVVTGSTTLTVSAPALVSVVVIDRTDVIPRPQSIASATIAKGTSHQFFAYGVYTDGGERNITNAVTWSSAPLTTATITNAGRANGISAGTAVITATDPTTSISGNDSLIVTNATVSNIIVAPVNETIAPLTRLAFTALGVFSDGTRQDITADANWSSTIPAVATVSNSAPNGIATGVALGMTTIQAALPGATGMANLSVSSASLTSIKLIPASSGVAIGSTLSLNAVGTFSDGTIQSLNLGVAAWSVTPSDGSIATVDQTGLVTGVAAGTATVRAKVGTVTQTATLNVQNLTSIAISPMNPVIIAEGTQTRYVATATLQDGTTQDISSSVTWISTAPSIATVSDALGSAGWVSGIAPGGTSIGAGFGGQFATSFALTVTNATLSSVAITPSAPQGITLGMSIQYTATGTFSDSSTEDLTNEVAWSSSDPTVAIIDEHGLATSTGSGVTTVKAAADIEGVMASDSKMLTVAAPK